MQWFYWFLLLLAGIIVLFAFVPVQVHVRYSRIREDDHIYVRVRALFITYTIEMPTAKLIAKVHSGELLNWTIARGLQTREKKRGSFTLTLEKIEKIKKLWYFSLENIYGYKTWLRRTLRIVKVEEFRWQTEMGIGDAAVTGTLIGLLWSVKGAVLSLISNFFTLNTQPRIDVRPRFHETVFITNVSCIFKFWVGQAMFAGIRMVFYWLREGHIWRNIRSKA
jgi:hypothetical protein